MEVYIVKGNNGEVGKFEEISGGLSGVNED